MHRVAPVLAVFLLISVSRADEGTPTTAPSTTRSSAAKIKIVLAGDSTVLDGSGWGRGFKELLADDVECVNIAEPSKSSRTYRTEGFWDKVMAQRGDHVFIQLGANDQPGGGRPDRETDAATEFRANMKRYADEVRAAGGVPILVTPLARRTFNDDRTLRDTLGDYTKATRAAAEDAKALLIDLHARSIVLYTALGPEKAKAFAPPSKPGRGPDVSHLNAEGGRAIAALIVEDLARVVPELAPHVKVSK